MASENVEVKKQARSSVARLLVYFEDDLYNIDAMTKISQSEFQKIFSSKVQRQDFVDRYEFFNRDGNSTFYKKYIESNFLSADTSLLIAFIDLSIQLDFFSQPFFKHIVKLFTAKRFWYRLRVLDYMFSNYERIKKRELIEINKNILDKSNDVELRFQAALNLYLVDKSYYENLLTVIREGAKESNHYVLYRTTYYLLDNPNDSSLRQVVRSIILKAKGLPSGHRKFFLNSLTS